MTNEEKIISMLGKIQTDVDALKKNLNSETPKDYAARKKALLEFIHRPLTPEDQKDADEFAEYIAAMDARKGRLG